LLVAEGNLLGVSIGLPCLLNKTGGFFCAGLGVGLAGVEGEPAVEDAGAFEPEAPLAWAEEEGPLFPVDAVLGAAFGRGTLGFGAGGWLANSGGVSKLIPPIWAPQFICGGALTGGAGPLKPKFAGAGAFALPAAGA